MIDEKYGSAIVDIMAKTTTALLVAAVLLVPGLVGAKPSQKSPKDKIPPKILSLSIKSSGANPSIATVGDTVTISFTANEKVTPAIVLAGHSLTATPKNNNGTAWEASFVVDSSDTLGKVEYSITLTDMAGNRYVCSSSRTQCFAGCSNSGSSVTIVAPPLPPPPAPFVMASQSDESFLCAPDWRDCYTGGGPEKIINLGQGSGLGNGTIQSVTIAKDETSPFVSQPWIIYLRCYVDAGYTQACPDWLAPNNWNAHQTFVVGEIATSTTDNKHWTAYFTDPSHEQNFDGSFPVRFNAAYYYRLIINDNGWNIGAYGTATEPYWVLTGVQ